MNAMADNRCACFLSVDLEDYKHATLLSMGLPATTNPEQTWRGTHRILSVVAKTDSHPHITFFTTGQVARDQPDLVRELARQGHEIACHSDQHENVYALDRVRFLQDLHRSKAVLERACGQRVVGYRAPNFSINRDSSWAYSALIEAGFIYDSSMVTASPRAAACAYDVLECEGHKLFEFPLYWHRMAGKLGVRVIGGTYFRLLPVSIIVALMKAAAGQGYTPILYLHASDADESPGAIRWNEMQGLSYLARSQWAIRQKQWSIRSRTTAGKLFEVLKIFPNLGRMGAVLPF
ncbi:MAG TPA: polysaccharide deacetylase family protein [Nitrospiraceae bacterium]|nr:polysaccharide deacetylase family protein [Nitrospiraceae bacterium]